MPEPVGGDGRILLDMLKEAGADTGYVETLDGASGHAVIQIDESGQNNIIICGGTNRKITREYISSVLEHFGKGDLILLQNEISNIDFAMEEAKKRGLQVAFNPSPADEGVFLCNLELVDYFILNEVEGRILAGTDSEEPAPILRALREKYKNAAFVLTLGDQGPGTAIRRRRPSRISSGWRPWIPRRQAIRSADILLPGSPGGLGHKQALLQASAAAALAVTKKGAAPSVPERSAVEAFIGERV